MHFSPIALAVLLGSTHIVSAVPTFGSRSLSVRDNSPPPPDLKDDEIPQGDARDLISYTDDDYEDEDYKNAPDYDPDQDQDASTAKRSLEPAIFKRAPKTPGKGTTDWLRTVGVNGQAVRDAYNAPGNMANRRFIGTTGPLGKTNQLGLLETPNEFIKPPRAKNYKNWQADHVLDLGFWTTIAKKDTPAGIQDDTWVTVQDAILGEKEDSVTVPQPNTKTLAGVANDLSNIRGITFPSNQLKNQIMDFAYGPAQTKASYKNWNRSVAWGLYRYLLATKTQFDEIRDRATAVIESFVTDQDQGQRIAQHYQNEINRIYNKAVTELERVLTDPPADNDKESIFKSDDCSNTKDSPITPPAGARGTSPGTTSTPPATTGPLPTGTGTAPPATGTILPSSGSASPATGTAPPATATAPPSTTTVPPASTTASQPTVTPVDPPSAPKCASPPAQKPKDAHEGELQKAAGFFCDNYANSTVQSAAPIDIAETIISGDVDFRDVARVYEGDQGEDDVYDFYINSTPGCYPGDVGYNLDSPVAGSTCKDLLYDSWKNCINQGRGGQIIAGCLTYGVTTVY